MRPRQTVKSVVSMSSYWVVFDKWYFSTRRQNGSISQLKTFLQSIHSAARSNPPIPENKEACVIPDSVSFMEDEKS